MNADTTRAQIVEAADELFYRQGFDHTSFADIAAAVKISRGNFYYHFKSKDDILDEVIEARLDGTRAMLARWDVDADTPRDRIECFIRILEVNGPKIRRYGCPVGTLTGELAKLGHGARGGATRIFELFRTWLARQFKEMGRAADADDLALQVLAMSQGVATLYNAFGDKAFVEREVGRMCAWLDALTPAGRAAKQRARRRQRQ